MNPQTASATSWLVAVLVLTLTTTNRDKVLHKMQYFTRENSCKSQTGLHGNNTLPYSPVWALQVILVAHYSIIWRRIRSFNQPAYDTVWHTCSYIVFGWRPSWSCCCHIAVSGVNWPSSGCLWETQLFSFSLLWDGKGVVQHNAYWVLPPHSQCFLQEWYSPILGIYRFTRRCLLTQTILLGLTRTFLKGHPIFNVIHSGLYTVWCLQQVTCVHWILHSDSLAIYLRLCAVNCYVASPWNVCRLETLRPEAVASPA